MIGISYLGNQFLKKDVIRLVKRFHLSQSHSSNSTTGIIKGKTENSLWFTALPAKRKNTLLNRRNKRENLSVPVFIPRGPPIITCKNEKLNHYPGQRYGKFSVVPMASKGWANRKSRGDFFIIHPTTEHPAFLMNKSDLNTVGYTFDECGLDQLLIDILNSQNKERPTTIQGKAIPTVLAGRNTLIVAETGCGKTLAYLLPMLQRVIHWKGLLKDKLPLNSPLGMIVVPNRELAIQIGTVAKEFCDELNLNCVTFLGGHTKRMLLKPDFDQVDIIVATLGCISKLTTHGLYSLKYVKQLVLDEADTLLDDSFNEKLLHFVGRFPIQYETDANYREAVPRGTQVCFASATMPTSLDALVGRIINIESLARVSTKYLHMILPHVEQTFLRIRKADKPLELLKTIKRHKNLPTMIFSNKAAACEWVYHFLNENNIPCEQLHSRLSAENRMGRFERFKSGEVQVISCTDITSRGIDSTCVKHVINCDFPLYMADYVHRCGRTGRIGHDENCKITNFVSSPREIKLVQEIEHAARLQAPLHNVNNNITKIIKFRSSKMMEGEGELPKT